MSGLSNSNEGIAEKRHTHTHTHARAHSHTNGHIDKCIQGLRIF